MLIRRFSICVICGKKFEITGQRGKPKNTCSLECGKEKWKQYCSQYWKKWYIKNHKHFQEENSMYNWLCSKEIVRYQKKYYNNNPDKLKEDIYWLIIFFPLIIKQTVQFLYIFCQYSEKFKLFIEKEKQRKEKYRLLKIKRKKLKQYCEDNDKNYYNEWQKQRSKERYKIDLKFNLNNKMTFAVYCSLKRGSKKKRHWESLVGYTCSELKRHLERTMPKNCTWQDFMEGKLHIDHIIPKSIFNFTKPEHIDFKRCWALDNLQLLPAKENHVKWRKLQKPFQPALQLII